MATNSLPLLIEPQQLQQHLQDPDLLIIDLCAVDRYFNGHISGAVHVSPQELVSGEPPAKGQIAPLHELQELFQRLGLTPSTHVVVYDDEGGGWAGRFIWTLDAIGHQRYSYLNGGIHAWVKEGLPLTSKIIEPQPVPQTLHLDPNVVIEVEDILPQLQDPDFVIWDARTAEEYRGEKVLAHRGGHIPGAIHCEWTEMMDPDNALRIRSDATERLAALGLTDQRKIVTHCQSHHRSGFTYLLGKILGFDIKGYHGSWSEWGNRTDTPIETRTGLTP